jgi:hypothetical protein
MADYLAKIGADDLHVSGLVQQIKALQMEEQKATALETEPGAVNRKTGNDGVTFYCGQPLESGAAPNQIGGMRLCGPKDGPQCGCCRAFPSGLARGQPLEFPEHWGSPPMAQTLDLVVLPGGGMGSGTLLRWIQRHLTNDEPEPAATADTAGTTSETAEDASAKDVVVAVGSKNPVKIEATRRAFQSVFRDLNVVVVRALCATVMIGKTTPGVELTGCLYGVSGGRERRQWCSRPADGRRGD